MKEMLTIFLSFPLAFSLLAQNSNLEIISSAGDHFAGNTISIDWTLGELTISTIQSTSQVITQGFHQPHVTITPIEITSAQFAKISIFPNPTSTQIDIELDCKTHHLVHMVLMDLNGNIIRSQEISGVQIHHSIDISAIPPGTYVLKFSLEKESASQTYKINIID